MKYLDFLSVVDWTRLWLQHQQILDKTQVDEQVHFHQFVLMPLDLDNYTNWWQKLSPFESLFLIVTWLLFLLINTHLFDLVNLSQYPMKIVSSMPASQPASTGSIAFIPPHSTICDLWPPPLTPPVAVRVCTHVLVGRWGGWRRRKR